jgi:hypothetical protein
MSIAVVEERALLFAAQAGNGSTGQCQQHGNFLWFRSLPSKEGSSVRFNCMM